jgi:hypothetical protein
VHFYLDADVSPRLVPFLVSLGHTATHTRAIRRQMDSDDRQFLYAVDLGAPIVTHNTSDYVLLHRAWGSFAAYWRVASIAHPGVVCLNHQRGVLGDEQALARLLAGEPPKFAGRAFWYDNNAWRYLRSPPSSAWVPCS